MANRQQKLGGFKVKTKREIEKLQKEINVLCSRVLKNFRALERGKLNIEINTNTKEWGLAKL